MPRQAMFKEDGTITDVPTKLTENPQLETQLDLLQFGKDTENLARLNKEELTTRPTAPSPPTKGKGAEARRSA